MYRNIANKVEFLAVDTATGLPKTGDAANITAYVSIDGGAVTALGDTSASELSSTNAKGVYRFDVTAAETNGDNLLFSAKSSTSGVEVEPLEVWTRTPPLARGTAQAGAAGSITLAAGESSVTDFFKQCIVKIVAGTGAGQARAITAYNGTSKVATVNRNWATAPDNTSIYEVWEAETADTDGTTTLLSRIASALTITTGKVDVNDKTGFSLSSGGVQAIWDAATSALTTVGSIGKLIVDNWTTILARLTSSRAGYLDNLNVGGNVASSSEVTAIQNNTRCAITTPEVIERPESGTQTYRIELYLYDETGNMEIPDSAPTIALVNQAGTDRSIRLDSTTMALVSTGRYRAIYTAAVADAMEQLVWTFSVVEGGNTRLIGRQSLIVDSNAVDFTATDRAKLDRIDTDYTTARAAYLDVAISSRLATASYTAPDNAGIATISGNVTTLLSRIPAALFTGITSLANWLRAGFRKANTDATAVSEVNADVGGGAGSYAPSTDALEAIRDRGDAAWGGGGGGSGETTLHTGTAQGGSLSTIQLDAGASSVSDYYQNALCVITAGTGAGQSRFVQSYNGTTKVATPYRAWTTAPNNTSDFVLLPFDELTAEMSGATATITVLAEAGGPNYCTQTDIENVYSPTDVQSWANNTNNLDAAAITARIAVACAKGTARVNDALRGGPYAMPWSGAIPDILTECAARLAGAWLYMGRGVADSSDDNEAIAGRLTSHVKWCEKELSKIRSGHLILDATQATTAPGVYTPDMTPRTTWSGDSNSSIDLTTL